MSLARVRDLRFRFGSAGPLALDGLDLDVAAGEVVLLEGPSGAGKSTLLRALGGLLPEFHGGRMEGRIAVCGHHVGRVPAARIARVASLAFQDPEAQAVMAGVERDVAFGPECLGRPRAEIGQTVAWALAQAGAAHLRHRSVTELSGGERQRVALAAVLAMRPRLLLLDEPTSQLDDDAAQGVLSRIRALADATGMGVVIAEHRADRAHPVVDRIVPIAPGAAARAEGSAAPAATAVPAGPEVARLEGVRAAHGGRVVLEGADLSVRAGEVTALVGPSGSGKTTLLRVLAGLHAPAAGAVRIAGEDVTRVPPERRFPRIGMVPQAPGRHLLRESVEDELALTLRNLGVAATERRTRVDREMDRHALRHLRGRHPLDLSVGERERVAIAATLVARPDLLALDEPTRGVDPIARRRIGALMRAHAAGGGAVLVATHDPHLVREWCDRTVHVDHGRLAAPAGAAR